MDLNSLTYIETRSPGRSDKHVCCGQEQESRGASEKNGETKEGREGVMLTRLDLVLGKAVWDAVSIASFFERPGGADA